MSGPVHILVTVSMIAVGLVAMYTILNAGNPDSLLRPLVPDPADDVMVAMVTSFIVFVLGFFVFYSRDREGFGHLVSMNGEKIRDMRKSGHADEAIADEILAAMGSRSGYRHNLARKKLLIALSEFE